MINLESLLLELSNAPGPSGFENPVREIMKRELSPFVDSLDTDGMGSLIAIKNGPSSSPNIMLSAHMDEVGLLVRYITDEGFIRTWEAG